MLVCRYLCSVIIFMRSCWYLCSVILLVSVFCNFVYAVVFGVIVQFCKCVCTVMSVFCRVHVEGRRSMCYQIDACTL